LIRKLLSVMFLILGLTSLSCTRSTTVSEPWRAASQGQSAQNDPGKTTPQPTTRPPARLPGTPVLTPTPDPPRAMPTTRSDDQEYVVQPNDTLGQIARRYGVEIAALVEANQLANPDHLEVGQVLVIPAAEPLPPGPSYKIIPDSELVYGPASVDFNIADFVNQYNGYLSRYREEVDGRSYTGPKIVERVAKENSVNPRLLLAVLEYRSGWVTNANPSEKSHDYPMLYLDSTRSGLYHQLSWAANNLDRGYYIWRAGGTPSWVLADDTVIPVANTLNAGTAGVQYFFSLLLGKDDWEAAVTEKGVYTTFNHLFGYPFDYAIEPLLPLGLAQPPMQLPFEPGEVWSFTGGPHGGWADGSGWAALDFAPPGSGTGCVQRDAWVVAVADGVILRADIGAVVQDLDGDGNEQTGWTVLYMHIESRERVEAGKFVRAGERIGHASCEGGYSTGTHLHLARRYNGEWIPADGSIPFNLDGWISSGDGVLYNGFLTKDGVVVEAWEERREESQISR
jgi:murein DD-endopeptidase MepM/ murein hydrolase activator NlpD